MDLIKEAESGSKSFQTAFTAICEEKEQIASKKASDMLVDTIAEQANPVRHTITDVGSETQLLPPQRVLSKGRPSSLRPKSRMELWLRKLKSTTRTAHAMLTKILPAQCHPLHPEEGL